MPSCCYVPLERCLAVYIKKNHGKAIHFEQKTLKICLQCIFDERQCTYSPSRMLRSNTRFICN